MTFQALKPGDRLGKYKVLTHIATGGMGAVYKAMDRDLRRPVALKVLTRAQNCQDLERFRREVLVAARLNHPNVVTLFDSGYDEGRKLYYLVMEFVDGIDLGQHIERRGRISAIETRRVLIQATEALDHAYAQGIIHRDIKPSNFLLVRVRDKVLVKLTDLGLALRAHDDDFRVTDKGNTVGTIDYMSPEQARDSRSGDIRSDIYSLGCTGYHMLTGKAPFASGGLGERLYNHQNTPPVDARETNPLVSAEFWGVIAKMLAKTPDDRYPNPRALLADLKRVPAEAAPPKGTTGTPVKTADASAPDTSAEDPTTSFTKTTAVLPRSGKKSTWPVLVAIGVGLCAVIFGPLVWGMFRGIRCYEVTGLFVLVVGLIVLGMRMWGSSSAAPTQRPEATAAPPRADPSLRADEDTAETEAEGPRV